MSNAKDVATRLYDFAAQENCDGEPYDTMQAGGDRIRELEQEVERLRGEVKASWCRSNDVNGRLNRLVEAAEKVRHWHDTHNGGMIVSGDAVRNLWAAIAEAQKETPARDDRGS